MSEAPRIAKAREHADSELKKALSVLDLNNFNNDVSSFKPFIHTVKLLFFEEAGELRRASPHRLAFERDVRSLRERIVDEYTKRPSERRLTRRHQRRVERPMYIDEQLHSKPRDKWDIFAPAPFLPNKKHAVRVELLRVLGEQLAYWLPGEADQPVAGGPPGSSESKAPEDNIGPRTGSPEDTRTGGSQKLPLEAIVKDEERREKAKGNLVRALQSYINKLDSASNRDAQRETEFFCDYAREYYASRAEPYLEAMPPMDPQQLFEVGDLSEQRELCGLPTIGDVMELVKQVKVTRPKHWPVPTAIYRGDESPELRRVLHSLIIDEHLSFEWLLEEPWDQWFRPRISDSVNQCVRDKRQEYEETIPISAGRGAN